VIELCAERYTPEWHSLRRARVTSSLLRGALAGYGTHARQDVIDSLLLDLRGIPEHTDEHTDPWILTARHDQMRGEVWYGNEYGRQVRHTGFVIDDEYPWLGFTPNGLVDPDGLIHVVTKKYRNGLRDYKCSGMHIKRVQYEMRISGRKWCDFVSYWTQGDNEDGRIDRVMFDKHIAESIECSVHLFWRDILKIYRGERK